MKKLIILGFLSIGIIIILFACFVWPTPYKYYIMRRDRVETGWPWSKKSFLCNESVLVRIQRVTGDTQVLEDFHHWVKVISQEEWQRKLDARPIPTVEEEAPVEEEATVEEEAPVEEEATAE